MRTVKVLLVVPDVESFPRPPAPTSPHVGLAYISAILEKHGHQVEVLDLRLAGNHDKLIPMLKRFAPDLLGISSYSIMYSAIYDLARQAKQAAGKVRVVIGGPHVGSFGRRVLEESVFDCAVRGEGEYTMLDLCAGKPYQEIPGLIWRDGDRIVENERRQPIVEIAKGGAHEGQEPPAFVGDRQTVDQPFEQRMPQQRFQLAHLLADRRGGHVQFRRRLGKAQAAGRGFEGTQGRYLR